MQTAQAACEEVRIPDPELFFLVAAKYDLNMALLAGPFLKLLPINLAIHVIFLKLQQHNLSPHSNLSYMVLIC